MTITASTESGSRIRLSVPAPTWEGYEEIGTGIYRKAIYVSPRAKRCVVETYSIWQDRHTGGCVGTQYMLVEDDSMLAMLAEEYADVADALEKAGMIVAEEL